MDPKELKESIRILSGWWCHGLAEKFDAADKQHINNVCKAAEAHLAALPREVAVTAWAVVEATGDIVDIFTTELTARTVSERRAGRAVICLSGAALLPPVKP